MARDYKKEYANYHSKPEQKHNRALRNAARRERSSSANAAINASSLVMGRDCPLPDDSMHPHMWYKII